MSTCSAFSKTRLLPELGRVLSCKSPAVFLHFPLGEKGPQGPFYLAGASKRETPTSNLTESTDMAVLSNNISVIDQSYVQYVNEYYQYAIFIVSDRTANSLQLSLMEGVLSELGSNN